MLLEELEDVFHDAHDHLVLSFTNTLLQRPQQPFHSILQEESKSTDYQLSLLPPGEIPDPPIRDKLPFFKDPKIKISFWAVLKDSIHKEISKISVPVYFNSPLNILQAAVQNVAYSDIYDEAVREQDPVRRCALIAANLCYQQSDVEKFPSKPFNPLLGETYELVVPGKYKVISEQIVHHPPVHAYHFQGDSGWTRFYTNKLKTKFARGTLAFFNQLKEYVELLPHNEIYQIKPSAIGIHNLIIGSPYLEPDTKAYVKNLKNPDIHAEIDFHKRGWSQESYYKVSGNVYSSPGVIAYKLDGKWNHSIYLTDIRTGLRSCIWTKEPYPENWEYMYGMTHFMLNLNYLPNTLRPWLPPTDTRLRPDQRALENGDFKMAASEKNRLEEKQRAVRRYKEKNGIEHKPVYFDEWKNPDDPENIYYKYNGTYFERDRKERKWDRCPDLFSEQLPPEVEEFERKQKK
ncbi:hypothetical protein FGO68_gene6666 [Halteria grandinella]|uniref:Oxysterol-binding protein n=1 Tax=Halteria grandinella TaxID=5974 RepID=A0A8J8P4W4_HALGN|nr:hypothetical protein FGO68_gene6666 [Halteria grandinella]